MDGILQVLVTDAGTTFKEIPISHSMLLSPSLSSRKFRYYTQHKKETSPHIFWQSGLRTFLFYLWQSGLRIFIFLSLAKQPAHLYIFNLWEGGLRIFEFLIFGQAACASLYFFAGQDQQCAGLGCGLPQIRFLTPSAVSADPVYPPFVTL